MSKKDKNEFDNTFSGIVKIKIHNNSSRLFIFNRKYLGS